MDAMTEAIAIVKMLVDYVSTPSDRRETMLGSAPAGEAWQLVATTLSSSSERLAKVTGEFEQEPEMFDQLMTKYLQQAIQKDVDIAIKLNTLVSRYHRERAGQEFTISQQMSQITGGGVVVGGSSIVIGGDVMKKLEQNQMGPDTIDA